MATTGGKHVLHRRELQGGQVEPPGKMPTGQQHRPLHANPDRVVQDSVREPHRVEIAPDLDVTRSMFDEAEAGGPDFWGGQHKPQTWARHQYDRGRPASGLVPRTRPYPTWETDQHEMNGRSYRRLCCLWAFLTMLLDG